MPLPFRLGRRRFRISIRSLMLFILVLCASLAIWTTRARRQEEAVRRLIGAGATVRYRHEFDAAGNPIPNPTLPGLQWLRNAFGKHAFSKFTALRGVKVIPFAKV
jgi:hypothetical protein